LLTTRFEWAQFGITSGIASIGEPRLIRSLLSYVRLTTDALSRIEFVLATMAIVAGLAFWTWADFTDAHREAEDKVSSAALAVEELVRHSFLAIDVVLEAVATRSAEQGLDKFQSELEMDRLKRIAARLPETGAVFVVDRVGNVVAGTASYAPLTNVGDRAWFRAMQDGKTEVYVGRALKGRASHTYFFPVARPIRGSNDDFIGAAQVGVEVTYFAHLFRSLDVGRGAHLGLYRTEDGELVARYPHNPNLLDETVAALPYFRVLATSQTNSWTGWTRAGWPRNRAIEQQLVSARRLDGWPLIVVASLPSSQVYASTWAHVMWRSAIATLLIAVLLMLTTLAVRQARREASLMGELQHRVKNMLAVVAAVAERAHDGAQSSEEFMSSLRGRLQSMAGTQTLLDERRGQGVDLSTLVRAELAPYGSAGNFTLDGPPVRLAANAAHVLAMTLHELATNAAKHGALSRLGGHVLVRWTRGDVQAPRLKILWEESGGPAVVPPARLGYGSEVIRELVAYELGGTVDLVFDRNGVRCLIEVPVPSGT
jgi:two-component sensor histidine kinase